MKETLLKLRNSKAANIIKTVLSWKFFPFITAFIIVGLYYLNLDMVSIYYIGITGILSVLLLDDLTPLFSNFLFMCIMVSYDHSPSSTAGLSDYYLQPAIITQVIIVITLYAASMFVRIGVDAYNGKIKPSPVLWGLCAFAGALLINGAFSYNYNPMNLVYGLFLAFFFLVIYVLMKDNVTCSEETYDRIAFAFLALSCALIFELAIKYLTCDELFVQGNINRIKLGFGWGMYNTMGMLMLLCAPSVFYLAGKSKFGYLYYIYAFILLASTFLTMSRQAMVGSAIIYIICIIMLLVNGKNKIINISITAVAAAIGISVLCVYWDKIELFLKEVLLHNIDSGNGRTSLWEEAWNNFKDAPLFGTGFYVDLASDPGFPGLAIIPDMYHNTFFQLIGSCGILGVITYAVHRVQTVMSFCKNPTPERVFIGITVLSMLILNLFDNHLFYLLPTMVYSALTAVLIKSQNNKSFLIPNKK